MTFNNVQTALVAGGIAVPLLVLFYFLKLRRRRVAVPSTLLWLRSVQDLHVNAFIQWLRHNWLLWLQLLTVLLLLLVLADPVINRPRARERRVVLMIDTSASMTASDDGRRTRLQLALDEAGRLVDGLSDGDLALVMAFAEKPRVLGTFTSSKAELHAALDAVAPTHGRTRLAAAMQIVDSLTRPMGLEPEVVLFSDGRIPDAADALLWAGQVSLVNVGRGEQNAGITNLSVRRNSQRPDQVAVQAEVRNFAPTPASLDVQLILKGKLLKTAHADLAAFAGEGKAGADRRVVRFDVDGGEAGVYTVALARGDALGRTDALAADDAASVILPPAKRMNGLLVSEGNVFLEPVLRALTRGAASPLAACRTVSPRQFESDAQQAAILRGEVDLVVLDGYHPKHLVPGSYLMFHVAPKVPGVTDGGRDVTGTILAWDSGHPVLRHASVELLYAARWLEMTLPAKAKPLIEANTGPVVAALSDAGREMLIVAFDPLQSNWPLGRQLAIFMADAVEFLGAAGSGGQSTSIAPGTGVMLPAAAGESAVRVSGPGLAAPASLRVGADGRAFFDGADQVGVYTAEGVRPGSGQFAVNLFDPAESRISPINRLTVGTTELAPDSGVRQEVGLENVALRPWLIWPLLGLLLLEWGVYLRKARV
jgi:hypothetical protein